MIDQPRKMLLGASLN